jgi:diguanylate cyclase (GGDEF)-like protein
MEKVYYLTWVDEDNLTHTEMLAPDNRKVVVGRSPTSDIVLTHPSVSRVHAQLSWKNNLLTLIDLNSSYGTWLNDKCLNASESYTLYGNGEIRVGSFSIWFEFREQDQSQEMLQTCFYPKQRLGETSLTAELNAFKNKLLQDIKAHNNDHSLSKQLEESINREIFVLNEKHEEQLKEQRILNSISHILNRSQTLSELSKNALDLISKVLRVERGYIVLHNQEKKGFELIAQRNFQNKTQSTLTDANQQYSNTLVRRCYDNAEFIIIDDAQASLTLSDAHSIDASGVRSIAVIPLLQLEQVLGVIYLESSSHSHCFEQRHQSFLATFAAHTSIALNNVQLYKRATTDDLTGLYTRQYIDERLAQEIERAKRYQRPFSILMVDLDHFKQVNDTFGHTTGDLVLQIVADILTEELRDSDIAGRLGGEEFIIILGETELDGAINFAERIREEIESKEIVKDNKIIKVTASIGLACYKLSHKERVERLIEEADKALYQAKSNGRNRVVISD